MSYTIFMEHQAETIFAGDPVTLDTLLASRERRAARQRALLAQYAAPVVCVLCNMPGPVKDNPAARAVHAAAMRAVAGAMAAARLRVAFSQALALPTGPEGYFCVRAQPEALKRLCCALEQAHPYGRLFDLDVIGPDGVPLSRRAFGLPPRACVVCGGPAADCVSRRLHPLPDVLAAVAAILREHPNIIC